MTTLSYAQLEQVWLEASAGTKYHTQQWAALMAAIAEAESGGRSDAKNANDPIGNGRTQTAWGLWQIADGTHNEVSPNWADPVTNARLAIQKLNGQGLGAWGTYTSGAYRSHLQGNVPPGTGTIPSSQSGPATLASAPGGVIGNIIENIIPGIGPVFGAILGAGGTPQTDVGSIASDLQTFLKVYLWIYNPAHWVRIGAFFMGVILLIGSGWMFKESI